MNFSRLLRGFVISGIASLPFFLLISLNIVGDAQTAAPMIVSVFSTVLFFFLNASAMRRHLQSVDDLKGYFVAELVTFACHIIVCELLMFGFAGNAYAALYMPVMLAQMLGMSRLSALVPAFVLYLLLVLVFPLERELEFRRFRSELESEENDEDEEDPETDETKKK